MANNGKKCGQCDYWKELTMRCPGWGHCEHPKAGTIEVHPGVTLSAYMKAAEHRCSLPT